MATNIKIIDDEYTQITREADRNDEWGADDTATSHHIRGFKVTEAKQYWDLIVGYDVKPEVAYYLVYVLYSTGDSFSHHTGRITFIDMYQTIEEAEKAVKVIEKGVNDDDKYSINYIDNSGNDAKMYCPWIGYFESLEDVNIEIVYKK